MEFKNIPEPFKTRIEQNKSEMSDEIKDIIDTSLESCPDWKAAQDSIWNCLQFLIDEATKIQKLTHKE